MNDNPHHFVLRRVSGTEWLIQDLSYAQTDARHVIACIEETLDGDVEIVWLREVPLPARHLTARAVLSDLRCWQTRQPGERPVPIPTAHRFGRDQKLVYTNSGVRVPGSPVSSGSLISQRPSGRWLR